jgi:phosphoglucosamine mutase
MSKKKYFGTDGIRGHVGQHPINAPFVLKLGWALGCVLANHHGAKVLIGKDTRISGYMFESALEAGLSAAGVDIHLLGPMPTPAIAYLTRTLRAQAGIVISASHNHYADNGIKFFSSQGTKLSDAIENTIEEQLEKEFITVESAKLGKAKRVIDAAGRYIEFCKSTVPSQTSLKGLNIVVDCAHGATYYVAPHVFRELGATVIDIGTRPDGLNINQKCGATHPDLLRQTVLKEKADLGIAFDGDGDRVIMVDHKGEIVDGDELLFIIVNSRHSAGANVQGVVGTQMTNYGAELAFKELGLEFIRTQVGDRYVMEELVKRNWLFGGEASGHLVCLDMTTTGDGIISALQVLRALCEKGLTLHELKKSIQKFPQKLINIKTTNTSIVEAPSVVAAIAKAKKQLHNRGRILIRPSGTEPVIRVMVEGENETLVLQLANDLASIISEGQALT